MKNDDNVLSFDMSRHAIVLALPLLGGSPELVDGYLAIGQPCVAMREGITSGALSTLLRQIADSLDSRGLEQWS